MAELELPQPTSQDEAEAKASWDNAAKYSDPERMYIILIAKGLAYERELKAALAANADLLEVMDEIDATLCACRYDNKQGCNCDIHAVHNIIRALKSRKK